MRSGPLLTAEWRHLVMLSYEIDPSVLLPHVPRGTELDTWNGRTLVTIVGFVFRRARLAGIPLPFHGEFGEVNLRFYVRRCDVTGWRRGVVFLKEIVPRRVVAATARALFDEAFVAMPLCFSVAKPDGAVEYRWQHGRVWNRLGAQIAGPAREPAIGSPERFVAEHYWAYTRRRDGGTSEYRVEHPDWRIRPVANATLDGNLAALYGQEYQAALAGLPVCAFVADGSPIVVRRGMKIAG